MGLYGNLNDVQSESIPLFLVILIANSINYLRSILLGFLQSMGFPQFGSDVVGDRLISSVGSGLAGLIVLSEQNSFCYKEGEVESSENCVVCLCGLMEGEQMRKLGCKHVFHKACLDGWLFDHLNLTCPLCRSPLVSDEKFAAEERRVGDDLVSWFSLRR